MFKRAWWRFYNELPRVRRRFWCWDTAVKTNDKNDFTVGMLIAECADGYYIERLVKERMEYPELKRAVPMYFRSNKADGVVIEDKSSGQQLIQDLRRDSTIPLIAYDPGGNDKILRASIASPKVEAGKVFLPQAASWAADFIETMAAFPDVEHDDEVDAFTMGIIHMTSRPTASVYVHEAEDEE